MMLKQPMEKVTWQGINTLYQHLHEWGFQEADLQPSEVFSQEDPWSVAAHSSILAWRIPWTEEPGGLQSIESAVTEAT